jgi:hypothetical protein
MSGISKRQVSLCEVIDEKVKAFLDLAIEMAAKWRQARCLKHLCQQASEGPRDPPRKFLPWGLLQQPASLFGLAAVAWQIEYSDGTRRWKRLRRSVLVGNDSWRETRGRTGSGVSARGVLREIDAAPRRSRRIEAVDEYRPDLIDFLRARRDSLSNAAQGDWAATGGA